MDISEIDSLIERIGTSKTSSRAGAPEGWIKASIILQKEHLEKIKDLAWLQRTTIRDILGQMISEALEPIENSPLFKDKIVILGSGWTKTTMLLPLKHLDKLKAVALARRTTIRDLLYLLLQKRLSDIKIRS